MRSLTPYARQGSHPRYSRVSLWSNEKRRHYHCAPVVGGLTRTSLHRASSRYVRRACSHAQRKFFSGTDIRTYVREALQIAFIAGTRHRRLGRRRAYVTHEPLEDCGSCPGKHNVRRSTALDPISHSSLTLANSTMEVCRYGHPLDAVGKPHTDTIRASRRSRLCEHSLLEGDGSSCGPFSSSTSVFSV